MFPKFSFTICILAFAMPFLLVTCDDKKTKEILPVIMQDQLVYQAQGYKIMINSFDKTKKEEPATVSADTTLEENSYGDPESSNQNTESTSSSDDTKGLQNPWILRAMLIAVFSCSLIGLIFQFIPLTDSLKKTLSVTFSIGGILFLIAFFICIELGMAQANKKMGDSTPDSLSSSLMDIKM
ncbi:MAG: hypothetical protein IAF38_12130, partial [Bacteroidia bacterium]|nr:hypothetical protein [Bacteroidia bacterium]